MRLVHRHFGRLRQLFCIGLGILRPSAGFSSSKANSLAARTRACRRAAATQTRPRRRSSCRQLDGLADSDPRDRYAIEERRRWALRFDRGPNRVRPSRTTAWSTVTWCAICKRRHAKKEREFGTHRTPEFEVSRRPSGGQTAISVSNQALDHRSSRKDAQSRWAAAGTWSSNASPASRIDRVDAALAVAGSRPHARPSGRRSTRCRRCSPQKAGGGR